MKFVVYLLINKKIAGADLIKETLNEIYSYLFNCDKLYIFNLFHEPQIQLMELLSQQDKIEYADINNRGEVINYQRCMKHAVSISASYATIMETGYYFEDAAYNNIKRQIINNEFGNDIAVVTPLPVLTCEEKTDTQQVFRDVLGAHLVGSFINVDIYKNSEGFYEPYYQTTFDYDYCLQVRKNKKRIVLVNNEVLRNKNFKSVYKRFFFKSFNGYERSVYNVYYETRNRPLLWERYKDFDKQYIAIDKKQQDLEFREMRMFEKNFKEKKKVIQQARIDYRLNKFGKAFEEVKF